MDRLNQLRGEPGGSRDSTLDTSSPPSEAFMTANESSSKYFSLSEVDSTFDISTIKDISLASASVESEKTVTESDQLISNLSPIGKKSDFDTYKIGKQIEAANILSGGVDIFDDNDNSYDGDELVIDDNAEVDDKSNPQLKLADSQFKDENSTEATLVETDAVPSKDIEVILQIDGKNVDAIDIGNGLYLYRKEGQEELAAVQIIDDDSNQQQPSFKFLKVRENNEGNLEVYEEIQIEVPKEVPMKEKKVVDKNVSHVPIKDISKVISDSTSNKIAEKKIKTQNIPKAAPTVVIKEPESESNKEVQSECKTDTNLNKKMKFNESRKSPVIGSFTPMTFHSTPNKEGIPLTKTMVDLQLHPNRHSDNVKKTIEVHTDSVKQRILESPCKQTKESDDKDKQTSNEQVADDTDNVARLIQDDIEVTKGIVNKDENILEEKLVIVETTTKDSQVNIETAPPIQNTETASPNVKTETATPIVDTKTAPSIVNTETAIPIVNTETAKPIVDTETAPPIVNTETATPVVNTETATPMVNTETASPIVNTETASPIVNTETVPPIVYTETAPPIVNTETVTPIEENKRTQDESQDVTSTNTFKKMNPKDDKGSLTTEITNSEELKIIHNAEEENNPAESESTTSKETVENKPLVKSDSKDSAINKKSENLQLAKDDEIKSESLQLSEPVEVLKGSTENIRCDDEMETNKTVESPNLPEPEKVAQYPETQIDKEINKIHSDNVNRLNDPHASSFVEVTDSKSSVEKDENMSVDSKKSSPTIDSNVSLDEKKLSTKTRENTSVESKIIHKETKERVTPDSFESSKKIELVNTISVEETVLSKIENTKSNPNLPESSKKNYKAEQSVKKTVNVQTTNITEDINSPNNPDTKEKHMHSEPVQKITNDVVETKYRPGLKNKAKNAPSEISKHTTEVDSVLIVTPAVATSEPPKNAPKVEITTDKEDHKIKQQDLKPLKQQDVKQSITQPRNDLADAKVVSKISTNPVQKPINNNHAPVPFGKWTDVNRQAFLNKIKESKVPTNSSNGKQIKNSNDLNRRDVLKKIDSQRQAQELANMSRLGVKKETAFTSKPAVPSDSKPAVKTEIPILKNNSLAAKKATKQEPVAKPQTVTTTSSAAAIKKETTQRKEINNQDLIDKTIEGIINRAIPVKNSQEENQTATKDPKGNDLQSQPHIDKPITQTEYDEIEMTMNALHGIPFIERPAHELPHVPTTKSKSEPQKTVTKPSKIPNLLPFVGKTQKSVKEHVIDLDSEEEVIEHEPITGDMDLIQKETTKLLLPDKTSLAETVTLISADSTKKETIITENDFDKFVRRNSINYENCLTMNFDNNDPHVVQTIVKKDSASKAYTKTENVHSDAKLLSPRKHEQNNQINLSKTVQNISKFGQLIGEDDCNKNYQSKVKMAYQTAMTAKRQLERPITIIEDRPVKVVYLDSNPEYVPAKLNVQGQELSPAKKASKEIITPQITDCLDSDTLDSIDETKTIDETKFKTKHQRKQVLTPVDTPELELIAPDDLGIEVSPKKKRRTEERVEKPPKTVVPKKTYLLGRGNTIEDPAVKPFDLTKTQRESPKQEAPVVSHKDTASAIDSLVKAAELLETQSASITSKSPEAPQTPDSQQNTPVKRGRGRPRKYPLPEGATDKVKIPSPQKKPRLIDAKVMKKKDSDDDYDDDSSTDDEIVKENWTMGKINENIVCPICNKLFRSENVVFKHVKHCTGPSPSRSDSDNKSPRRLRDSQESETKSFGSKSDDMDIDETITPQKDVRKKRKSKDSPSKITGDRDDVIVIEDTPIKPKLERRDESKPGESRKTINKNKFPDKVTSLVCEFCGKTFRQLSYLVNHKLQHGKEDTKKIEDDSNKTTKSVFSCETCKKEFRKLHHLVQHRIIHNPGSASAKLSRKSSSEQHDDKTSKDQSSIKHSDDPSAGFRCEPCDKSFRKLHHLVEHRETHDGINRQKITSVGQTNVEKLPPPPQCEICKKTFRKLHHLIEHKEQHLETSSEKSDDKSIKSSLSTKDIIHECSLCYMVFPNEHSLNKHTIICQRKKRQSATKQSKQTEEGDKSGEDKEIQKPEENKLEKDDDVTIVSEEFVVDNKFEQKEKVKEPVKPEIEDKIPVKENTLKLEDPVQMYPKESPSNECVKEKPESNKLIETAEPKPKTVEDMPILPIKVNKTDEKEPKPKVQETPRKKTSLKDKAAPTVSKRHKPNVPLPIVDDAKPSESSDDDEIRYMLNPDYKFEDNEGKLFMKVRANKRNSLQIERPNSKDLVKRRISLQHPPKVPRLKPKPIQNKVASSAANTTKTVVKAPKPDPVPSTDSDDSDVKYSFPEPPSENVSKPSKNRSETSSTKEPQKKTQRKSLAEKRKSLSSIAKRKSLGKTVAVKHKTVSPVKPVRKRTAEAAHRCDCGQLFGSAALLARHATLAHTPPRIRRRRSPPPAPSGPASAPASAPPSGPASGGSDPGTKPVNKPAPRKSTVAPKSRPSADSRKSSVRSDGGDPNPKPGRPTAKRKSSINRAEPKTPNGSRKSPKSSDRSESVKSAATNVKLRRYAAHKGVPVPEKMRKLMEKSKK